MSQAPPTPFTPSRRSAVLAVGLVLTGLSGVSCQNRIGFDLVSIKPVYGWVDGCTPIQVSGTGFGNDVNATLGGVAVNNLAVPDANSGDRLDALNAGFTFFATTPPAAGDGNVDLTVTTGSNSETLPAAFYYEACIGAPYLEYFGPADGIAAGTAVLIAGCNLTPDLKVRVLTPSGTNPFEEAALTSVCSTAQVTFSAPSLTDGSYAVEIVNGAGDVVYPLPCDTADTAAHCDAPLTLTYGSAS